MKNSFIKTLVLTLGITTLSHAQTTFPSPGPGNVGIGTSSPAYLLDVKGGFAHFTHNTASLPASSGFGGLAIGWNRIGGSSAEVNFYNVFDDAPKSYIFSQKLSASPNFKDLMTIQSNGYVGIGTTAPEKMLHIFNAADAIIRLHASNSGGLKWDIISSGGSGITNSGHFAILDVAANANRFDIDANGNIGMGTLNPQRLLHLTKAGDAAIRLEATATSPSNVKTWDIISSAGQGNLYAGHFGILDVNTNTVRMSIDLNGNVHIGDAFNPGTPHANSLLSVKGKIGCKEVVVTQLNWSDFVFDKNYKLMPLNELENYYKTNHHLPEVPSASEISESGNDLGKTDALLLQKIEELTLYIVEIRKELDTLKSKKNK